MMLCMISLVIEFNVLSISSPNISLAVFKEKALAMDADLFAESKGQTQNCILAPQIYSFLFRHFVKSFRLAYWISGR